MGLFKTGSNLIKNLFTAPQTSQYPKVGLNLPAGERGSIAIEEDACTLCGLCQRRCPADAINVDREEGHWLIDRMKCIACGECVYECPEKCLQMMQEYTSPDSSIVIDVFNGNIVPGSDDILKGIEMPMEVDEFPEELRKGMINTREVQARKRRRRTGSKKNNKARKHRNKSRS